MENTSAPSPAMPAALARYLRGAPPQSRQFDFLLGDWTIKNTRYNPDGSELMRHGGSWNATSLNDGRMVMDNYKGVLPGGQEFFSVVTLRTYNEVAQRWDMCLLYAHEQPADTQKFHGQWMDGEMHLEALGTDPMGRSFSSRIRFFAIEPNRFEWQLQVSMDGGTHWGLAAAMVATRVAQP